MVGTAISSHEELASKQLPPASAAGDESLSTATRGNLALCNCISLSHTCGATPSPPRSSGPSPLPIKTRGKFCLCIFLPAFGTGPDREGAAVGAGGGEGGVISYLFIYLALSSLRSPW